MHPDPEPAPHPDAASARLDRPAEGLPLPPLPVPGVDFPTLAQCYRALHRADRS